MLKQPLFILIFIFFQSNHSIAQKNQNIEISALENGNFTVYKVLEISYNNTKFEKAAKPWPINFIKENDEIKSISLKRAGVIDESYQSDLPGFPAYYYSPTSEIVISVIDKKIYYYKWSAKSGAEILYILTNNNPGKYVDEKTTLENYRKDIKNLQSATRSTRIEENTLLAEKETKENSLEGKEIKAINLKLIDSKTDIGMLSMVSIGIEVVLVDGTILKTKNLGGKTPYADFEFEVKGGDYAGGDFKVANDSRKIPNDKLEISTWSKYDPKMVKGIFSLPINYKNDIFYQYQGASGSNGRGMTVGLNEYGGNGKDGRSVKIQAENIQINGTNIIKIIITDYETGDLLSEAKIHQESSLTINVNGGNGGSGVDGSGNYSGNGADGGNAGNGGNVILSGNASSNLKIVVMNTGGKGGSGGSAKSASYSSGNRGADGIKGTFIK
jgi:hypothetical protein